MNKTSIQRSAFVRRPLPESVRRRRRCRRCGCRQHTHTDTLEPPLIGILCAPFPTAAPPPATAAATSKRCAAAAVHWLEPPACRWLVNCACASSRINAAAAATAAPTRLDSTKLAFALPLHLPLALVAAAATAPLPPEPCVRCLPPRIRNACVGRTKRGIRKIRPR